ncbi:MAG: hypothetical protein EOS19_28230 [Mesorhizobium sp.]|nr:MAG: hypothetical protein EOS19_28230 [Mesorhizobium sp.]
MSNVGGTAPPSVLPDISPTWGRSVSPRLSPITSIAGIGTALELPISLLEGLAGSRDGGAGHGRESFRRRTG